jgi:hypothetical protein
MSQDDRERGDRMMDAPVPCSCSVWMLAADER